MPAPTRPTKSLLAPALTLLALLVLLLAAPRASLAQAPVTVPTPVPALTPVPYPEGPPPVATPAPILVQETATPEEILTEAPTPDESPSAEASSEPSPTPAEAAVTQTEALWMLRLATGKDVPVNTLKGATGQVLKDFQKANGLEDNGRLDDLTVEKLRQVTNESLNQLGCAGPFREALKAFQKERGLGVDGDMGKQTATTLGSAIATRRYQEALQKSGAYTGPLNGKAGEPEFKAALEKYQKEHGLKATGTLDDATRKSLQGAPPAASPSPTPTAATAPARGWSPIWHWLGGWVLGVLTMLALMVAARRAGRR